MCYIYFFVVFVSCNVFAKQVLLPQNAQILSFIEQDNKKRVSSYPYISGDTFRSFCDHIFDETKIPFDTESIKVGDTIFVNRMYLNIFFSIVHPAIPVPYVLVTHNYVHSSPGKYKHFLDDEKIIAWFAQNIDETSHLKLYPLPLGLANRYWPHGNALLIEKVKKENISKDKLLYVNFLTTTHSSREAVLRLFKDKPFVYAAGRKPYEAYLRDIARSKFVLSPRGNGIDCHRTWEAILMGSIPVVPRTSIVALYEDLPVLVVDDWSIITQEYLERKWQEFQSKEYDLQRCMVDFWLSQIKKVQQAARSDNDYTEPYKVDHHI